MLPDRKNRTSRFKSHIRRAVFLPVAIALVLAALLFFQLKSFMRVTAEVAESNRTIARIERAGKLLSEAESSMRGFLLSRYEEVLEPYHRAGREIFPAIDELSKGADPSRLADLAETRTAVDEWLRFSRWPIRLAAEGRDPLKAIPRATGRKIRQRVLDRFESLNRSEQAIRETRLGQASRSARLTLFAGLGALLLLGGALAARSRRSLLSLSREYEGVIGDLETKASLLFESREWFSATLTSIGDGVIVVDARERIEFLNPVAEQLTGWKAADAVGRRMTEVFTLLEEGTRRSASSPVQRVLADGNAVGLSKHTMVRALPANVAPGGGVPSAGASKGRGASAFGGGVDETPWGADVVSPYEATVEIPIEDSASPIRGPSGQTVGVVLVFRDVSEKRFTASLIAETEKRFQALANSAPVLIWTAGKDRFCDWFNENWLRFRGRALQDEIGSGWLEGIHPEDVDRALRIYMNAFDAQKPFEMGYRFRRADGEYRDVLNRGSPRFASNGRFLGYIGSCTDISQSEGARKKLEALTVDLERAVRSRDEFLSIASHELKTPLTSLQLQLQLVQRGINDGRFPSEEKIAHVIGRSLQQATRITNLIDELLDISRIQEGKLRFNFESVDLARLVEDQVSQHTEQFKLAGCDVRWETTRMDVECDRFRMEQVIVNLLTNAMKYGGRKPVLVVVGGDERAAWIRVSDQGAGIPKDRQEQIFNRFERGEQARNISGLGLGLYIARQIVAAHRGSIAVVSDVGQGSQFTVTLPRKLALDASARTDQPSPGASIGSTSLAIAFDAAATPFSQYHPPEAPPA